MTEFVQPNGSKLYFIPKIAAKQQTAYQKLYFELISAIHGSDESTFDKALEMIDAWHASNSHNHNNNVNVNDNDHGLVVHHNTNVNDTGDEKQHQQPLFTNIDINLSQLHSNSVDDNDNNNISMQLQSNPSKHIHESSAKKHKHVNGHGRRYRSKYAPPNNKGWTPIMFAVHKNRASYVSKLLAHGGIDPNVYDSKKRTLLHMSCELGYPHIAELLLMNTPIAAHINALDKHGQSPVFVCCMHNNVNTLKCLLNYEMHGQICDINLPKLSNMHTCLYIASDKGYKEIVTLLLQYKHMVATVNTVDSKKQFSPLMRAVIRGHSEIVQMLLTCGANINHVSVYGRNSLMYGIRAHNSKVCKVLLNFGNSKQSMVDLYATDFKERDAFWYIHQSIKRFDERVVKQLRELYHGGITSAIHFCRSDLPNGVIHCICMMAY